MSYKVGETVLVKGKVTRKIENEGQTPMYRLNMSTYDGNQCEVREEDIAGSMMNIVKLEEGKEE